MSKPIFKKSRVEQTINLSDEFGVDFKGKRSLREAIGGAIIEQIRRRTKARKGMDFKSSAKGTPTNLKSPYSKAYSESLDFKAFGKSRGNVNMSLTGDMLGLLDVKRQTGNSITIGWDDQTENAKAYNHSDPVRGPDKTVPYRPFFGVSKKELQDIKKKFGKQLKSAMRASANESRVEFEKKVAALLKVIDEGEDIVDG